MRARDRRQLPTCAGTSALVQKLERASAKPDAVSAAPKAAAAKLEPAAAEGSLAGSPQPHIIVDDNPVDVQPGARIADARQGKATRAKKPRAAAPDPADGESSDDSAPAEAGVSRPKCTSQP